MMEDYFAFLGFPRMLTIDPGELQQRYFKLSREHHPDFHAQDDETSRQQSEDRTSHLNRAYATLKDPFERARYLVSIEWPDLPDDEKKKIPPELLMEVMEMQEKVAEVKFETDETKRESLRTDLLDIESRLREKMEGLRKDLEQISSEWNALLESGDQTKQRELLRRLNGLLNTRNYLRTLIATIGVELHGGEAVRH